MDTLCGISVSNQCHDKKMPKFKQLASWSSRAALLRIQISRDLNERVNQASFADAFSQWANVPLEKRVDSLCFADCCVRLGGDSNSWEQMRKSPDNGEVTKDSRSDLLTTYLKVP